MEIQGANSRVDLLNRSFSAGSYHKVRARRPSFPQRSMIPPIDHKSRLTVTMSFARLGGACVTVHGRGVAHKTLRVWRLLWTIMQGMKIAHGIDPSRGVGNRVPDPRHQRWTEGEAVRMVKAVWRQPAVALPALSPRQGIRSSVRWACGRYGSAIGRM